MSAGVLEQVAMWAIVWVLGLMGVVSVGLVRSDDPARQLVLADVAVQLLVVVLFLTGLYRGETHYLAAAVAIALLSFVATVVLGAYIARDVRD